MLFIFINLLYTTVILEQFGVLGFWGATTKQIRRDNMINANIARKGETRLATTGNKNHFYGKGFFGADNHFYGKKHSEETLAKMRIPRLKYVCQHCNTTVGGKSNYNRWHGNNCKLLIGEQNA